MDDDWVFASLAKKGKQPYWPDNLMKRYIKPVARKAGITKNIGCHSFRHSFGTLLKANGEDIKTVQEFLRHVNSRITLDFYTQSVTSNKRGTAIEQGCKDDGSELGHTRRQLEHNGLWEDCGQYLDSELIAPISCPDYVVTKIPNIP